MKVRDAPLAAKFLPGGTMWGTNGLATAAADNVAAATTAADVAATTADTVAAIAAVAAFATAAAAAVADTATADATTFVTSRIDVIAFMFLLQVSLRLLKN